MSDTTATADRPPPSPPAPRGAARIWWLLPALTFVAGVVLGAVVVGAITSGADSGVGGSDRAGGPATSATPAPGQGAGGSGDVTVTVPSACADLAAQGRQAVGVLDDAAAAAKNLDAQALADVVRRMQGVRDSLAKQSDACGGAAAGGGVTVSRS